MSKLTAIILFQVLMLVSTVTNADIVNLTDGTILEGEVIGRDNGIVIIRIDDGVRAIPENQIAAVVTEDQFSTSAVVNDPAPIQSIPAGTRLVISMLEDIDTRQHAVGHQFRASLESALQVNGNVIAPRGTVLHGTITQSAQAGRVRGRSELSMEFRGILINSQLHPISTNELRMQGSAEGGRTLQRAARGAIIGGIIDGSDGARTGAEVGAGISLLTKGERINVKKGTILETELRVSLNLP